MGTYPSIQIDTLVIRLLHGVHTSMKRRWQGRRDQCKQTATATGVTLTPATVQSIKKLQIRLRAMRKDGLFR